MSNLNLELSVKAWLYEGGATPCLIPIYKCNHADIKFDIYCMYCGYINHIIKFSGSKFNVSQNCLPFCHFFLFYLKLKFKRHTKHQVKIMITLTCMGNIFPGTIGPLFPIIIGCCIMVIWGPIIPGCCIIGYPATPGRPNPGLLFIIPKLPMTLQ